MHAKRNSALFSPEPLAAHPNGLSIWTMPKSSGIKSSFQPPDTRHLIWERHLVAVIGSYMGVLFTQHPTDILLKTMVDRNWSTSLGTDLGRRSCQLWCNMGTPPVIVQLLECSSRIVGGVINLAFSL
ncbi:hypothetical protein FJTKL_07953 [Diaporthe vaccinii]|uniref:Uncharacterized protein n=1 Tax=Diaporthe vaccinii TaxID=105482 RepID=A0ABR4FE01_9PEZI